jgi:glucokinase
MAGPSVLAGAAGGTRQPEFAVAVDIGGTKLAAAAVARSGELAFRMSGPTPANNAQGLLDAALTLIRGVCESAPGRPAGVGVAVAGAVDPDCGDVRYAPNIPALHDYPLQRLLSEAVGLPVLVGFDGHLTALGEYRAGAGRGSRNMVLLTVGTGIGGGLILDGQLYRGSDNLAGAAGWMIADPATLDTAGSQATGNLERVSAGPGIAAALRLAGGGAAHDHPLARAEDALAAAQAGDQQALAVVSEAGRFLAYAVTGIVSLLNPDKVIIGGGLGSTGIFLAPVKAAVAAYAQPTSRRRVVIETAALGPDAALVGAGCALFEAVEKGYG